MLDDKSIPVSSIVSLIAASNGVSPSSIPPLEMNTNGERYATNEKIDLIYFIYETSVDVIKNKISREIVISPKAHETIINIFDGHVKMRRDAKKEMVLNSLKSTLESIVIESKKALDDAKEASKK